MLEKINSPENIKHLSQSEISVLAAELRESIIKVVGKNGGHLASNLGVIELTIALHRVFSSPKDAFVWDVSHQCYAHKMLTGRFKEFDTLRQKDGISGFTNKAESEHDYFINGHSSTSISSALGLLTAWELNKRKGKVVAIIGDGALTGGMALEGLCNAGQLCKNLIVVLNDNQMSIDHNIGAISRYLSRLTMTSKYQSFRYNFDKHIDRIAIKIPSLGKRIEKFIFRFKRSLKGFLLTNNLFTDLGFEYVGPLNGHDEADLEKVLKRVSKLHRPVVVHVVTKKGKGYDPAEKNPEIFHGVGPFEVETGTVKSNNQITFTDAFSDAMVEAASNNPKIVGITAAMAKGTGLSAFEKAFPDRFFDVGIAEQHAVTFAGGLAEGGLTPVVCIYSTFIQRSIDQLFHDISLQNSPAVFMIDRAGAVPGDGVTHQGIFDIALFRPIPDMVVMSPASKEDLKLCFNWALTSGKAVTIRYPKMNCPEEIKEFSTPVELGKWIEISNSENKTDSVLFVITGGIYTETAQAVNLLKEAGVSADICILRFIKPLNEEALIETALKYKAVVFVEDGVKTGGISEYLQGQMVLKGVKNTKILAFEDKYYNHGTRAEILEAAGLSPEEIKKSVLEIL